MTSFTKGEEERHDNYQRKIYENLQHNSKAAWLQGRWLEISEQEHRAQIHNQKLLQDFQRAQDTLNDMVARTEAMNTIRVQYEQYLVESFPRWQQRLKDIRVSEKSKQIQQHLKSYIQQMEKDEGIKPEDRSDFRGHRLSSNSPDPSQPSHTVLNTHQTAKDIKQNAERFNHHPYIPPTWLTGSQPFISGLPQNNFPKDYKNLQNIQALNHPLPPYYSLPGQSSHCPDQQKPPSADHVWAGVRQEFMPTAHFTPAGAFWPRLPVLSPMTCGNVPDPSEEKIQCSETDREKMTKETLNPNEESCQRPKHRRNGKESDRSSELDCRPVRLSIKHEESSESSAVSSKITVSGVQKWRKKRNGTKSNSTENRNKSQGSSSVSQNVSDSHSDTKISKTHQKPSKCNSKESIITEKNVDAVMEDEDKADESRSQEVSQISVSSGKKDESEGINIKEEEDSEGDDIIVAEEKTSHREAEDEEEDEESVEGDEEAGLDDEAEGGDEGSEQVMEKRHGAEPSDREEPEMEGDVPEEISDSGDGGETTEEGERDNSCHEKETGKTQGHVDDEREIHNSLEESEEEGVYNQEIEDDEEEDDEVVVEKAYPWSRHPLDDHTKCPDDDDDDIEGLLNPVNSQTQQ
ncbi:hypothetical protein Q8A67_013776 [Cirrhinus molitorella]|uniref:Glutamic acid-rich protein-like n=1 Tax=Cirrhinus molitorella TaxID=172907 RepID=A0AA88TVI8_9TELE|nr:hypothetical protein Q8A67_013776 [Cirrhinus molitorella]